jgi:hypothetical protein
MNRVELFIFQSKVKYFPEKKNKVGEEKFSLFANDLSVPILKRPQRHH